MFGIELTYEMAVAIMFSIIVLVALTVGEPKKRILEVKERKYNAIIESVDMTKMPEGMKYQQKLDWVMAQNSNLNKRQANSILAQWDRIHCDA